MCMSIDVRDERQHPVLADRLPGVVYVEGLQAAGAMYDNPHTPPGAHWPSSGST